MKTVLRIFILWLACIGALSAEPARSQHVEAELVANVTSVQPGKDFWIALRMKMDPHWHTYWVNPGDAGLVTEIKWEDLPAGLTIGDIQWPVPHVFDQGGIINYVYEGEVYLMMKVTAAASLEAGDTLHLKARADWLECDDKSCVPGGVDVALDLPVDNAAPAPSASADALQQTQDDFWPRELPGSWVTEATQAGDKITLTVTPLGEAPYHDPGKVTFFSENLYIEPGAPQVVTRLPNTGALTIELTKSEYFTGTSPSLPGVLRAEDGWLANGEAIGMTIDPAFGAKAATPSSTEADAASDEAPSRTYLGLLALAFVGGLILNLMPCVFPVIGLKVMGFVNQAGESPGKVIAHGLVYTLGVLMSFWVIGLMFEPVHQTFLDTGQAAGGWAAWLTPRFVLFLIILVFVFSLSLSGMFEIGVSAIGLGSSLSSKAGYVGTFSAGLFAVAVGAPCAAPFLAPVLGSLVKTPLPARELLLTMMGLGLAAPYLILSLFPKLTKKLPRPGAWMETFKQGMAFLLYATVAALVWVIADQVEPYTLLAVLICIVLAGMGSWVFGRWGAINKAPCTRRIATAVALILIVGPVLYTYGRISENERREQEIQLAKESGKQLDFIVWEPWSPQAVAALLAEGRPVYIDFTARWCATCQVNKRVYHDDSLIADFQKNKVATLRADWTDHNLEVTHALAEFDRSAVPFNVLYIPGRQDPVTLPELLTVANVKAALANINQP